MLLTDGVSVITYDQQSDRERIVIDDQRRVAAIDYYYAGGNTSMILWTDTASRSGENNVKPRAVRNEHVSFQYVFRFNFLFFLSWHVFIFVQNK